MHADYQEGLDAYQKGDYDKALGEWLEVTRSPPEQVHPGVLAETYYAIAMLFWTGQGVPQDTSNAAKWLQQAAEMHHAGAQTKLGYLCSSGQGVPQSDFEALKWFQMAAWQGDADAQYNLGVLYREGLGVEPNQAKALEWFREAASNGDAESAKIVAQYEAGAPVSELFPEPTRYPTPKHSEADYRSHYRSRYRSHYKRRTRCRTHLRPDSGSPCGRARANSVRVQLRLRAMQSPAQIYP